MCLLSCNIPGIQARTFSCFETLVYGFHGYSTLSISVNLHLIHAKRIVQTETFCCK